MRSIEQQITPLIESQFPAFYQDEGPLFILFAKEYFKWLETYYAYLEVTSTSGFNVGDTITQGTVTGVVESIDGNFMIVKDATGTFKCKINCDAIIPLVSSSGGVTYIETISSSNTLYQSRNLFRLRDLDKTPDIFLKLFKEKYLKNVKLTSSNYKKTLIKAANDLFRSKGTERSIDFLFKLVYGSPASVYYPGEDILKVSNGKWVVPEYLELSVSPRIRNFIGKEITGSYSGAKAFIEYVIERNIGSKTIHVAHLSGVRGNFIRDDIITENGIYDNAPVVVGSLTEIIILEKGRDFTVGEIVNILSPNGTSAKARVSSTLSQTGIVEFYILDGGWGYTLDTNIIVSDKIMTVSDITNTNNQINDFLKNETVNQPLYTLGMTNITGGFSTGDVIVNGSNATGSLMFVNTITTNTASIIVNTIDANMISNGYVSVPSKKWIATSSTNTFFIGETVGQYQSSTLLNTAGTVSSIQDTTTLTIAPGTTSSNGLHVGQYVIQTVTGARGVIAGIQQGNSFNYSNTGKIVVEDVIGVFSNTDTVNAYPSVANLTLQTVAVPSAASNSQLIKIIGINGTAFALNNTLRGQTTLSNAAINVIVSVGGYIGSNSDISATAELVGQNTSSIGISGITNIFYNTPGNFVYGESSNTYANITFVSYGSGAGANVGVLDDTEVVRVSDDFISANNDGPGSYSKKFTEIILSGVNAGYGSVTNVLVQEPGTGYSNSDTISFVGGSPAATAATATIVTDSNGGIVSVAVGDGGSGYQTTPNTVISTSTGSGANTVALFSLGFKKAPYGDLTYRLIDLFTYETLTIGSISSLTNLDPGSEYNADPFIDAVEGRVASYNKKDIILNITNLNGRGFAVGETVIQTINSSATSVTLENLTGNTTLEVNESVYSSNSTANNIASGVVYQVTGNSTVTQAILSDVIGTFAVGDELNSVTSNTNSDITAVSAAITSALAKGKIKEGSNTSVLYIKRISLFTDFNPDSSANNLLGTVTGSNCAIVSQSVDANSLPAGHNAVITANVISTTGAISTVNVISSGYGYLPFETVTLQSPTTNYVATGRANVHHHGHQEGRYLTTDGFLNNDKFITDGEYYQEFSYEVQSVVAFDEYVDVLKSVLHVAGTKLFGKFISEQIANSTISIANSSLTLS